MIALVSTPAARAAIDDAIDAAVDRMHHRAAALGPGAEALVGAISRATVGGKRFRPHLVVAAFESLGGSADREAALYPVAAAFELLHTAFVVHDDVIDHDTVRRGIPNVAGEFRLRAIAQGADAAGAALLGDTAAILAGDLLLHEAGRLVALADTAPAVRERLLALLDEAVFVSAAGELADVENAVSAAYPEATALLDTAQHKTAVYSFSAPLCAGAALAGADADVVASLERFGGRLGLAFQLIDDLIGAFGTSDQAGRDSGGDLREAKRTPLVALARETDTWPQVSDALALAPTGPIAIREAQRVLAESGARTRLLEVIEDALRSARQLAHGPEIPDRTRHLLLGLVDAVQERTP